MLFEKIGILEAVSSLKHFSSKDFSTAKKWAFRGKSVFDAFRKTWKIESLWECLLTIFRLRRWVQLGALPFCELQKYDSVLQSKIGRFEIFFNTKSDFCTEKLNLQIENFEFWTSSSNACIFYSIRPKLNSFCMSAKNYFIAFQEKLGIRRRKVETRVSIPVQGARFLIFA